MDLDKWVDWVWVPAAGLALAFARWVATSLAELRKSNSEAHVRAEEQMLSQSKAIDEAISALHEKANAIRAELADFKVDAERRFVTQHDLEKTESHLSKGIADLTRAIDKLSDRVS